MTALMRMTLPLRTDARMYRFREAWIRIFNQVCDERQCQEAKWGEQRHPHHPADLSRQTRIELANEAREACERAAKEGRTTWAHILFEEAMEAQAEDDPYARLAELIQVMAVCTAQIEQIYEEVGDPCMSIAQAQDRTETLAARPA